MLMKTIILLSGLLFLFLIELNAQNSLDKTSQLSIANYSATGLEYTTAGDYLSVSAADTSTFCNGYVQMSLNTSYNGSNTLQYTWAASPYLSNTNTNNPIAGPITQTTTFYVTVTDGTLSASDSATVSIATLPNDSICLVSVMDSTNDNIIVFEKHVQGPIDYYKIYKETTVSNVFDSIGFIPADSAGTFIDTAVNTMIQAYRYKISSVDSCGNESALSNAHRTIHLTINQGLPGQWALLWNNYEGVPINFYRIWRADLTNNYTLFDSVPGNITLYFDLNPPAGFVSYQIEAISPYMCLPYNYKGQTYYNTSFSNKNPPPQGPIACFNATPKQGAAPLAVAFTDCSMGYIGSWLWDFGDGDTAMTKNPNHIYTIPGVYDVKLRVSGGGFVDSIIKTAFIDVVSFIEDIDLQKALKVYPNPASDGQTVIIEVGNAHIQKVELFDIVGKQIYQMNGVKSKKVEVRLNQNHKGLFFIKVTTLDGQTAQRKTIIK